VEESSDRSVALTGQSISTSLGLGYAVTTEPRRGYVALLDALGFRDFVARDKNNKNIIHYLGTVGRAVTQCGLPTIAFSDTIVLTVEGEGSESLLKIVKACSHVLGEMIRAHIPVKGAIAFGEFVRSSIAESAFLAGPPILDAYYFEQQQDWVGALLAPSAIETVREMNLRQTCDLRLANPPDSYSQQLEWKGYLQAVDVPFHAPPSPNFYKGVAVVPGGSGDLERLCESLNTSIKALNWMQAMAPSPKEQRKHQATIEWLTEARKEWNAYLQQLRTGGSDAQR
jgi:hypothetical protein